MKKNFLFACLLFTGMLSAQIVNIPDANFKNFLVNVGTGNLWNVAKNASGNYVKIDTNNDGQIQVSEALVIRSINIYQQTFSSVEGIEAFTNLKTLWVRYSPIISINLSSLTSLEELYCNDNQLSALNLSNLTNLKRLNCGGNNFTTLNLNGLANLQELKCNGLNLTSLDLLEVPNLKVLQCAHNHLASIALDGLTLLEELSVRGNPLTALNVSGCTALKILETTETQLQALDISALLNLNEAKCGYTYSLESVNIGYHPNMTMFDCTLTNVESLNLSGCPILQSLMCASTSKLQYVNIKNGPQITWVDTYHNNYNRFLCVDEGEELSLPSHIYLSNVNVNSYCTFTPGGVYNTIAGTFTFDGDGNGCSESDTAARNIKIGINDGSQSGSSITNATGNYNFYTQAGNFTLTPQFENNWFTATPATATVNFADNNNNTATKNFCIAPNGVHPDVEVVLVPVIGAQPGFDTYYKIIYKNKGNQTLSGNVVLNFDESILDYVSIGTTAPASTSSGQLTWAYSNLLPFESRTINVALNVNGPMETPPVNLDDVLNYSVSITPTAGDETPYDNTFTLNQIVTGSYDPNDITCLEGDTVHPDKIGEYLHYNINFENTGTAPATFIVVKDVINAQQYDINSLQMLHASHNVETRINGNKVEFFFDNINLGPLAKGNVVFKIKTKQTVSVNSTVMNKAEIFFDYNWPIVTNEAETTFALLSVGDFATDNSVTVFPNPAITHVTIKASSEIVSVQLYDMQGRLLMVTKDTTLDVSNRASGIYFVKVMTDKGMKVEKLVRK